MRKRPISCSLTVPPRMPAVPLGALALAAGLILCAFSMSAQATPSLWTAASDGAGAREVRLGWGDEPFALDAVSSDLSTTRLAFSLESFLTADVEVRGAVSTALALPGASLLLERGAPELPVVRASVAVADRGALELRVSSEVYEEFTDVDLPPSKGSIPRTVDPASVPYEHGPVYGEDAWYPPRAVDLGEPYILRDTRGVVVSVNAFQYNPVRRTLRVLRSATIEVVARDARGVNELQARTPVRSVEFERLYASHYVNANALVRSGALESGRGRYTPVPEVGPMLIIAFDDFVDEMEPLVEWKNQSGVPTTLVPLSSIGSDPDDIRSYIQNAYDTDGIAFVLLVGDADQMPTYPDGSNAADPMYSLLAGADSYPDILVGRFSAETAEQVMTQVMRSVEYESQPQVGAGWYHKATGIASNQDGGTGTPDWEFMNDIRDMLLGFTFTEVDQIYDPSASTAAITAALNEGRSLVNYMGHGATMGWSTGPFISSHVNALTNDDMLPWIVSTACYVGKFHTVTCFAEVWMRATNGDRPTGAVGIYASSVSQDWVPPLTAHVEIMDLLVSAEKRTLAGLYMNGACAMIDAHGSVGADEFTHWHVFGDPSLRVRTNAPDTLTVAHDGYVAPDASSFTVQTAAGAVAALSDSGRFIGSAIADGEGLAVVSFADTLPGDDVLLTVTGFNRVPVSEHVPVGNGSSSGDTTLAFALSQNYPNPIRRGTAIAFSLPVGGDVSLVVYDVAGRRVSTLAEGHHVAGDYQVVWEGKDDGGNELPSGVYFYRLETPQGERHRKMLLLR